MFHCASITHTRLHAAVWGDYFRTIFPRLKHRGSFLLWCGDGMTGLANQALSFSVNMFYSLDSVRASSPFVCVSHWSYSSSQLAAENVCVFGWNSTKGITLFFGFIFFKIIWHKTAIPCSKFWTGWTALGHSVLPVKSKLWPSCRLTLKVVWTETFSRRTSAESQISFFEACIKEQRAFI